MKKNYLIDIDVTICEDIHNEEAERFVAADVLPGAKEQCNKWYDEGHIITFFTARTSMHRGSTVRWLEHNGFKYHNLLMDKPRGGNYHWIDNLSVQATRFDGRWSDLVKTTKTIETFEQ